MSAYTAKERKAIAARLRGYARDLERSKGGKHSYDGEGFAVVPAAFDPQYTYEEAFTCNLVQIAAGSKVKDVYARRFGFSDGSNNEHELWHIEEYDRELNKTDLRILMLGFAAAMVETGDL